MSSGAQAEGVIPLGIFDSHFLRHLGVAMATYPGVNFGHALSRQQIASKKWAVEAIHATLGERLGLVFVLGGWFGVLPAMMFESGKFRELRVRSFDLDPRCADIAECLNRSWVIEGWRFKASTADMYELDYAQAEHQTLRRDGSACRLSERPELLVNLACEHLAQFERWLARVPAGLPLVLQSNNFRAAPDHCNCVASLEEFKAQAKLKRVLYEGTLPLEGYDRYMLIGSR